jgi:sugar O-acyltransferase (sialic acid O-acetyltransferase NeuD family)
MGNKPIDIVIFGTGGHAREMHDSILAINKQKPVYNFIGFLDQFNNSQKYGAEPILGDHTWLCDNPSVHVVIAIGSSVSRSRVSKLIRSVCKNEFQTLIHPTAYIGQHCKIGTGSMIAAGAVLTCNVSLGEHTIVNVRASLSHEVLVENFVTIAPNVTLCGAVSVAEGSDIGAGATVIQQRKIGAWSIIGAGAVVINDVNDNVTVVGNPARVIVERKPGWQDD